MSAAVAEAGLPPCDGRVLAECMANASRSYYLYAQVAPERFRPWERTTAHVLVDGQTAEFWLGDGRRLDLKAGDIVWLYECVGTWRVYNAMTGGGCCYTLTDT